MDQGRQRSDNYGGINSFSRALPALLAGTLTPRELLERCLERIAARESEVKAFVVLNTEGARAAADAATARYRAGTPLSSVDGCPVGIKDIMDTCDLPTQMGSPIFKGWQPAYDAACVQALRKGGAVIVGKTVTTAFACGASTATRNPYDTARTPGGSSSGSAAAVGAGMLPVALGTQTQGSLLRPAAYCGAVGFKPTYGVLPVQGVHPISATHDHLGVIGTTLDDTWRIASHISLTQGSPGQPFLDGAAVEAPAAKKPRRLIRLYMQPWEEEVAPATRDAFEAFIEKLKSAGVEIIDRESNANIGKFERALDGGYVERSVELTTYEMKWPYEQYVEKSGGLLDKRVLDRVTHAAEMTPAYYAELLAGRREMQELARKTLMGTDAFITLTAPGPAPVASDHTGSRAYQIYATFLGLPAFSLPLLTVERMPLGVQLIGMAGADGALAAMANWLTKTMATENGWPR
ncbi:MAG TPA: amidase [Burkholderiales bacterium]|nr:amidase [Burkholderiales bacterium]